jgi:phosphatidylglycerol---prolipoprotein diacylglyceryl transferase
MTVDFDPVALALPFKIAGMNIELRWYALMYVLGYVIGGYILGVLCKRHFLKIPRTAIDSYINYLLIGMVLGARIFYVFIYNWDYYSNHWSEILAVWQGGLSFHGAVVGMSLATYLYAKKFNLHFFHIGDAMAIAGSPGLFLGRIGNFINGELYGRITDSYFGIIFPKGGPYPRHASQLYEGIFEGIFLFLILWILHKRVKYYGFISSLFVIGYGFFRYIIEFFREPDSQLGYYLGGTTTMGQILCLFMIACGFGMMWYARKLNLKVDR